MLFRSHAAESKLQMTLGLEPEIPSLDQLELAPLAAALRRTSPYAALGPLPAVSDLSVKEALAAAMHDKKVVSGTLHFVAARGLGATTSLTDVTKAELRDALVAIGLKR